MTPVSPEIEKYVRELFNKFVCHNRENMRLKAVSVKEVAVSVTVSPGTENCYGFLQGGYNGIFTDSPMWFPIMTDRNLWDKRIYSKTLNLEFFKMIHLGEALMIYARHSDTRLDENRRPFYTSFAEVKNEKGELVTLASATFQQVEKEEL